jgi:hypothetical protein
MTDVKSASYFILRNAFYLRKVLIVLMFSIPELVETIKFAESTSVDGHLRHDWIVMVQANRGDRGHQVV